MSQDALNHPTAEELRALSLGQLADAEMGRLSDHLGQCTECCRRLDQLATGDPFLSRLQAAASEEGSLIGRPQLRSAARALRRVHDDKTGDREGKKERKAETIPPPKQVGEYDILSEVGRGGMGVVYKARHRSLHRLAAVKMVLAGEFASSSQQVRFRLEAELAARMQHPNIVQLFEIDTHEGRPFLAMEWVEGGSLASRLNGRPWPVAEAAALVETLARAIHVAHSEGIVHRDLKPANILLSVDSRQHIVDSRKPEGGIISTASDKSASLLSTDYCLLSIPKITDFGLAQPTEGGMTLTQSGFLVGTPGYMAPEQAGGKRALVGPATDTYALGVMLYQMLTGQLPFQGDSTLEVLRAVTSDEPVRLRRLQPRLPRDLEAITLHCLEKEPGRRYPSALALAEDLERFREGKQVMARPVGAVARMARACRRRPLIALLVALLTMSLLGGLAGVSWKWLEANGNALQAIEEKHEAQYQTYRARIAAAVGALALHDVADARRQLDDAPPELRDWEWHHLHSRLDDSSAVIPLPGEGVGWLLAAPDHQLRVGAMTPAGLRLTDLKGDEVRTVPIAAERWRSVFPTQTRHGVGVVAWVGDNTFDWLDEAGQALCRVELPKGMVPGLVVASPDGTRLAYPWRDGAWVRIGVYSATTGKQTAVCDGHRDDVFALTFSPDSTRLASGSEDKTARLWDAATGALLATCRGHTSKILGVAFSPDGTRLVTTSSDATVRQWDAATGEQAEVPYDRHSGEVTCAAYSPDGQWVASAGTDRTVRVWAAKGRQDAAVLHGHTGAVYQVAFAPGGRRLASLSNGAETNLGAGDNTVRVWDVDPRATLPVLHGHDSYVYPVAFSPDGRWIASGAWDNTVRLWDATTGEPCAPLPHPGIVRTLAFGPDGRWLVTGGDRDDRLRIWDLATACVRKEIPRIGPSVRKVALSPDGARIAVETYDEQNKNRMSVWDVTSREQLFAAEGRVLAYSPDGRWLAGLDADNQTVLVLDARTHETAARFEGHKKVVYSAAFSPDSRLLATCSQDSAVHLWQVPSGACRELTGHTDEVFAVAFHKGGTRLATGGRDGAVWLWDLKRGEQVARLPGHITYIWSLAFSPDGTTLASGSGDSTVRLWDTAPLQTRNDARREAAALRPIAEGLVEQLWQKTNKNPEEVVKALRADPTLSEAVRQATLREVLRRVLPPEAAPGNPPGRP